MLRLPFEIVDIGIFITTVEDVFHKLDEYGERKSDGIFLRDSGGFGSACENNRIIFLLILLSMLCYYLILFIKYYYYYVIKYVYLCTPSHR